MKQKKYSQLIILCSVFFVLSICLYNLPSHASDYSNDTARLSDDSGVHTSETGNSSIGSSSLSAINMESNETTNKSELSTGENTGNKADTITEPILQNTENQSLSADASLQQPTGATGENSTRGVSRIEKILSGQFPTNITRSLVQFGYDFFDSNEKGFTALDDVPVGNDYVIGPGDAFTINIWGNSDEAYNVSVNRDGSIIIPQAGAINVSGLTFKDLETVLSEKLKEYIPDFKMSVTMKRIRTIEVFLVGECRKPGTYSVNSLSTIISALYAAGGPSKTGSLRSIKLLRDNEIVSDLDLYEFFIGGNKKDDVRLKAGDTIVVPVIGKTVGVAGNIKRPAIYEIKGEKNIAQAIDLAGGILPSGDMQSVIVERIMKDEQRVIKTFNLEAGEIDVNKNMGFELNDFDVVKVYPIYKGFNGLVSLEGHVKYPREYELKSGMTLGDILPSYDSLLPGAYFERAEIIRFNPPDLDPEIIPFNLNELFSGKQNSNILLKNLDHIRVYSKSEKMRRAVVHISGAVNSPGVYPLYKDMTVRDLIFMADNLSPDAYLKEASINRIIPDESQAGMSIIKFSPGMVLKGDGDNDKLLKRDDRVFIKSIPQYSKTLKRTITLEGEFKFPGEYTFLDGETLGSLIQRAGGLTRNAYTFGAQFFRESVKEVQARRLKEYIDTLEQDIYTTTNLSAETAADKEESAILRNTLFTKQQLLDKLKTVTPTGRMVIKLDEIIFLRSPESDFELKPGDRLVVGERPDTVNILGEVYNSTSILEEDGRDVGYYLDSVGGLSENADRNNIYVVRADGTVTSKSQEKFFGLVSWETKKRKWSWNGGFDSIVLQAGDTIIVPRRVQKYPWLRTTKDVTQVMYQIAVSAGIVIAAF